MQKNYKNLIDLSIVNPDTPDYLWDNVNPPAPTFPTPSRLRVRNAFSLAELLLVIGVIAILIALIFPAIGSGRELARKVSCLNNLRQVGTALRAYAFDRNGALPGFGATDHSSFGPLYDVHRKLFENGYAKSTDIFFCPADTIRRPLRDQTGWAPNPEQNNNAARFSGYFHFYHRVGSNPTSTLADDKVRARTSDNPKLIVASDQWGYGPFEPFHKDKGIHILRIDGTVEAIDYATMKQGDMNGIRLYYRFDPKP